MLQDSISYKLFHFPMEANKIDVSPLLHSMSLLYQCDICNRQQWLNSCWMLIFRHCSVNWIECWPRTTCFSRQAGETPLATPQSGIKCGLVEETVKIIKTVHTASQMLKSHGDVLEFSWPDTQIFYRLHFWRGNSSCCIPTDRELWKSQERQPKV